MTKRFFDLSLVLPGIIAFFPLIFLLAILVRINIGSPILFTQKRPGYHGRLFHIYKFRTMSDRRDCKGNLLPDNDRIVPFGRFLRSTSLDELPELINILKGEMSLVGPRPLLTEYLERYSPEQSRRHDVRPGITGWAQVNGRNAITWEEKFKLDVWYVDNHSILLDIAILLKTVVQVARRKNINHSGEETMPRFTGKKESE